MNPNNNHSPEDIHEILLKIKLRDWAQAFKEDIQKVEPSHQNLICEHLGRWANIQFARRRDMLIASRIKQAKFKRIQTVDGFDFNYNEFTKKIQKSYLALLYSISPDALPSAVFVGTSGLGKTRLARSLGYASCQRGLSAFFITAAEMVNRLAQAMKTLTLDQELHKYRRPQVLIIDELGYVTMDQQASNLFFQVISARHDQGLGTIVTSNLPFGKYNQIFANDAIAHAIVDRITADAEVFFIEGDSYRGQEKKAKRAKIEKTE